MGQFLLVVEAKVNLAASVGVYSTYKYYKTPQHAELIYDSDNHLKPLPAFRGNLIV